jgi:colicin import membrane protein
MSHVLNYPEPNRLASGMLVLTVHAAFVALLMFSLRWQSQPAENLAVELWEAMPDENPVVESVPVTPPAPPVVKAAPPPPLKADIEVREKKADKSKPEKPAKPEKSAKQTAKENRLSRLAEDQRLLEEYAERQQHRRAEQARVSAEINAATAAEVGRFEDMIRNKVRRNIVMPPDVPENAVAEFRVTTLPGGMVMDAVLLKSSGNTAYDNAAERAIYKAQPLPLPTDKDLQKMFRELRLTIRP